MEKRRNRGGIGRAHCEEALRRILGAQRAQQRRRVGREFGGEANGVERGRVGGRGPFGAGACADRKARIEAAAERGVGLVMHARRQFAQVGSVARARGKCGEGNLTVGERMRRGLILVGGNAGPWAAANMLAGTVVVAGECGPNPGLGLRRGSLILLRAPPGLPATFNDGGVHDFLFLTLLDRHLRGLGAPIDRFPTLEPRMRRYSGDLACGGAGEILVPG